MQHRSSFLFPSHSLNGSRTLLHRLVPIFSACPTDAVSCSGSSVFVRCDGKRILGAGREWCMHRLSSVDIEHRFRVNSYWLRSIYRSVNFSQVMDSLGAQLTCLTNHSGSPFQLSFWTQEIALCMEDGVRFRDLLDIIRTALNSSSATGPNHDATSGLRATIFSKISQQADTSHCLHYSGDKVVQEDRCHLYLGISTNCHPTMWWESVPKRAVSDTCLYLNCP